MNDESREALNAYYRDADSWAASRQDEMRASRRVAWWVASGAAAIAVIEAFALILLTPLKTVVPYTLMVDRHTGFVQALQPLDPQTISGDKALTQSFLVQYVIARESFDIDGLQANYRRVALWSADSARSSYIAGSQASNPDSPLARYPRATVVETEVKSVSQVEPNVAMVRFDTIRRDAGAEPRAPQSWVAIVRYGFSGEPLRMEDRMINPLGFKVVRYQRNAEMLVPSQPAAAATAPAQAIQLYARPAAIAVQPAPTPVQVQAVPAQATQAAAPRPNVVAVAPAPAPTPVQLIPNPVQPANQNGRVRGDFVPGNRGGFGGQGGNFGNQGGRGGRGGQQGTGQ